MKTTLIHLLCLLVLSSTTHIGFSQGATGAPSSPTIGKNREASVLTMIPINPGMLTGARLKKLGLDEPLVSKLAGLLPTPPSTPPQAPGNQEILKTLPNTDMFIYVLDSQVAASLGLTVFTTQASKHSSVVIQEFIQYRDEVDSTGKGVRIGIGVRLFITVNQDAASISTASIPWLAASAQASKLQASVRMQVIGIQGKSVTESIPMPSELTFTTLQQLYKCIDQVKGAINAPSTTDAPVTITPQPLSISLPDFGPLPKS